MAPRGLSLLSFSHHNFLTSFCLFLTFFCPSNSWLESGVCPSSIMNQNKLAWLFCGPQFKLISAPLVSSNSYAGCPSPRNQSNQNNISEIPKQIRLKVKSSDLNNFFPVTNIFIFGNLHRFWIPVTLLFLHVCEYIFSHI